jgi:peptidoglycan/xylan/chitin deacetylase (PgdA/CDA1 family)
MRLPILMYHYVRPNQEKLSAKHKVLELSKFTAQIEELRKKYSFITGKHLRSTQDDNSKSKIWLTFDDGYRDCIDHVLPTLLKFGAVGTFYVPTEAVYERKLLDVNKIHILLSSGISEIDLLETTKQIFGDLRIDETIGQSFDELYKVNGIANAWNNEETEFLKKIFQKLLPIELRKALLDRVFCQIVDRKESSWVDEFYLTPDDVRRLTESGMEIGSHGHSHEWLSEMTANQQRSDLIKSLSILKSELSGHVVESVCYPFGSYDSHTLEILKENEIKTAVVNKIQKFAEVTEDGTNMLELDRIDIMFFDRFIRGDFS